MHKKLLVAASFATEKLRNALNAHQYGTCSKKKNNKKKNDRASIGQNSAHTLKRKKQMWVYDMEVTE